MGDVLLQRCGSCKVEKPLDAFSPSYRGKSGSWCRECFNAYSRGDWKATTHKPRTCEHCGEVYTPKQIKAAAGGDFCSKRCRRAAIRRSMDPVLKSRLDRDVNIKKLYGMSGAQFDELLAVQNGRCANLACGMPHVEERGKRLMVDHDHKTGAVRGLLCSGCNSALGMVDDDVDRLTGLVQYALNHRQSL